MSEILIHLSHLNVSNSLSSSMSSKPTLLKSIPVHPGAGPPFVAAIENLLALLQSAELSGRGKWFTLVAPTTLRTLLKYKTVRMIQRCEKTIT